MRKGILDILKEEFSQFCIAIQAVKLSISLLLMPEAICGLDIAELKVQVADISK